VTRPVRTAHLSPDRLEQAWPLIREIAGDASLDRWRAFARTMQSPVDPQAARRGILVAERKRTIRGLVTYETVADLSSERVLQLRNAVVMDLALREPIAAALYRHALDIAVRAGCGGMRLEVAPPMAWIGDVWEKEAAAPDGLPVTVVSMTSPVAEPASDRIVSVTGT
jgi:hypothetical protein